MRAADSKLIPQFHTVGLTLLNISPPEKISYKIVFFVNIFSEIAFERLKTKSFEKSRQCFVIRSAVDIRYL